MISISIDVIQGSELPVDVGLALNSVQCHVYQNKFKNIKQIWKSSPKYKFIAEHTQYICYDKPWWPTSDFITSTALSNLIKVKIKWKR
jgi:hypothetical protein